MTRIPPSRHFFVPQLLALFCIATQAFPSLSANARCEKNSLLHHSSFLTPALLPTSSLASLSPSLSTKSKTPITSLALAKTDSTTCRRNLWSIMVAASLLVTTPTASHAYYDKRYPDELVSVEGALNGRERKKEQVMENEVLRVSAWTLGPQYKPASAVLWGTAAWLLSGSRSTPLATPLANLLYSEKKEEWLKDRNDGLFATLPTPLLALLAAVFLGIGWGADSLVVLLADGDRNISLQLAGVSIISGASLELGRIASGEKAPTRDEADRDGQLAQEFAEFAQKRLQPGGNCHRTEVVRAFRRYFAKYRQSDSEEYPLTDLEIERLLKSWTAEMPTVERTSSGFYYGIQINKEADVFARRL